ncbi:MAG TPA: hypothetical protein PLG10_01235 [Candidatus Dojkabacteria bacterium]|nr:hypothetical protein [Candidatus Dojkabacteria bacterium]
MKKLLSYTFFLFFFLLLFPRLSFAQEEIILFWGENCPYCHTVRDKISAEKLSEKINIVEIEVQKEKENISLFKEKVSQCNINPERAGIPLLFVDKKCYKGVNSIMEKLKGMIEESEEEIEAIEEINLLKGKANTEKMIVIVFIFLVLTLLFGYYRQDSKKGEKKRRGGKKIAMVFFLLSPLIFTSKAYAICPLCTVAVGAGVGVSRSLGIDDVIVGLWIGGLLVSSSMWLFEWLKGKKVVKKESKKWLALGVAILMYALVLVPLKFTGIIGHPFNTMMGIDKVVFGIVLGSIVFFSAGKLHFYLKRLNREKVYIPYQKVILPVGALWLTTIILYLIVYY